MDDPTLDSTCHQTLAREIIPGGLSRELSFVFNSKTKEVINPSAINQMFELDFIEHKSKSKQGLSQEDRNFLRIAEQGIHRCEDGYYELPLPLRIEPIELPNNRNAALRRLHQLKRRFKSRKGQKYYSDYMEFMKKLLDSGYAEGVPEIPELERERSDQTRMKINVWYTPHHGVYHPKKPDKNPCGLPLCCYI